MDEFLLFVVEDQLADMDIVVRKMFGGYGLYLNQTFFGIIYRSCLYLKTHEKSRKKFITAGMKPFRPHKKQTLKTYYQVPADVLEDAQELKQWVMESAFPGFT